MAYELAVIDPGLMELGGHHAGFATSLQELLAQGGASAPKRVKIYAHTAIDQRLAQQLMPDECAGKMEVELLFSTNFYQLFEKQNTIADANSYINKLAREYFKALLAYYDEYEYRRTKQKQVNKALFFYPCLSWEHANALSIALSMLDSKQHGQHTVDAQHVVCAMYNPGINHQGSTTNLSQRVKFYHGFRRLARHACVRIFASDKELSTQYQQLLQMPKPLPIHPCYLLDWAQLANTQIASNKVNQVATVLLYSGDAKQNKGINLVPELVDVLANNSPQLQLQLQLQVQYTISWQYPEIAEALVKLSQQAEQYSNFSLYNQFWNQSELIQHLIDAEVVLLPYNAKTYSDKSSGFLWLCAALNKPVILLGESWLSREAKRLGVNLTIVPELNVVPSDCNAAENYINSIAKAILGVVVHKAEKLAEDKSIMPADTSEPEVVTQYRAQIFGAMFDWFKLLSKRPT
ncbi:hypothetical protein [Shewanella youngdeokensis]|uniref:Uncharacterized protein n=1 Tax=Shewanella youngdeokensis TaxID=2999068 RepID=A0ABZ0K163_9GAMM|nr:hypothetical protein RGE70_05700 [Shewanella sp. DAU334]